MYLGMLGFPYSGQDTLEFLLNLVPLKVSEVGNVHGFVGWKQVLPTHRPTETTVRDQQVSKSIIPISPVIHLMRYPWHAIAEAAQLLSYEDLQLIKEGVGIHPRAPATHLGSWESKIKVLTLAFPKWYDMIREQNPDTTIKIEQLEAQWPDLMKLIGHDVPLFNFKATHAKGVVPVDYHVAGQLAGSEAAGHVEVIAKNLYKRAPVV